MGMGPQRNIVYGNPFTDVDWHNKDAVIAYAKRLGSGQSVVKFADRTNYNITHTEREEKLSGKFEVIFRTGG